MNEDINEDFFSKRFFRWSIFQFSALLKYVKFKNADKGIEEFIFN